MAADAACSGGGGEVITAIRAALERLLNAVDVYGAIGMDVMDDAIAAARAALAEPVGEGPPAATTSALLHPAYEPGDGSADGAQIVDGEWWQPAFGCDSLQIVVDNASNFLCCQGVKILRSRWGRPAAPPAPLTDLAARLISESKPMDPEIAEALTPEARWDLYEGPVTPAAPEVVGDKNGCARIELVTAIHCLASHFEIACSGLSGDDFQKAKNDIAHAKSIAAKHNQNGPGCPQFPPTSPPAPEAGEVGSEGPLSDFADGGMPLG